MDPRNVAHDKKVIQEKIHHGEDPAPGAVEVPKPGKKPELEKIPEHPDPASERKLVEEDKAEATGATPPTT